VRSERTEGAGRKSGPRDVGDRRHCEFARFLAIVNRLSKASRKREELSKLKRDIFRTFDDNSHETT